MGGFLSVGVFCPGGILCGGDFVRGDVVLIPNN